MPRPPIQTTQWVADKMKTVGGIEDAEVTGPHTRRISRHDYGPVVAGIISLREVQASNILLLLNSGPGPDIIINVSKESCWRGDAIDLAKQRNVAFGGLKDLMSCMSDDDIRSYVNKEYEFLDRGFRQHRKVSDCYREYDRLYLIRRREGLGPIRVVVLNEYELTGDHIRTARDRYGFFDEILLNNPNGKPTASAEQVASQIGARIFMFGELLRRLNQP